MKTVNWYKVIRSKTIWVNAIALIAIIAQSATGFVIAAADQAAIIVFINLILRTVTNEGLFEESRV